MLYALQYKKAQKKLFLQIVFALLCSALVGACWFFYSAQSTKMALDFKRLTVDKQHQTRVSQVLVKNEPLLSSLNSNNTTLEGVSLKLVETVHRFAEQGGVELLGASIKPMKSGDDQPEYTEQELNSNVIPVQMVLSMNIDNGIHLLTLFDDLISAISWLPQRSPACAIERNEQALPLFVQCEWEVFFIDFKRI